MSALGDNVWLHQYLAFVLAGTFAGIAGAMLGASERNCQSRAVECRDLGRLLPAVLAQVGLRIVRLTPTSPPRPRPELSQPLSV